MADLWRSINAHKRKRKRLPDKLPDETTALLLRTEHARQLKHQLALLGRGRQRIVKYNHLIKLYETLYAPDVFHGFLSILRGPYNDVGAAEYAHKHNIDLEHLIALATLSNLEK